MQVDFEKIRPNPFRDMERYPTDPKKIEALVTSIKETGFWDNIVAREQDGEIQQAYGHHRVQALKEYNELPGVKKITKVNFIIKKLDDETILKILAHENMREWGADLTVIHETVRATIKAFGDGRIELEPPPENTKASWRHAGQHCAPYTAPSVAKFLSWDVTQVRVSLQAIDLVDQGVLDQNDFCGIS